MKGSSGNYRGKAARGGNGLRLSWRQRFRSRRRVSARILIPNAITVASMCCALFGVRLAMEGRFDVAIIAVVIATVLDSLDGWFARVLKGTSDFGANLDSLADVVNFGVAPAIIVYSWVQPELGTTAWLVVMAYTICIALRLARFNAGLGDDKPQWQKNYFSGVPAPVAAYLLMAPLYLVQLGVAVPEGVMLIYSPVVAWFSVSTLPTFSSKQLSARVRIDYGPMVLLAFALFCGLVLTYPWETLTGAAVAYYCSLPLSNRAYGKRLAQYEQSQTRASSVSVASDGDSQSYDNEPPRDATHSDGAHDDSSPQRDAPESTLVVADDYRKRRDGSQFTP